MHAKMTRDRKKCFVASIKRVIIKLEEENQRLREILEKSQTLTLKDGSSTRHCERTVTHDSRKSTVIQSNETGAIAQYNATSGYNEEKKSPSISSSSIYTVG